MALAQQLIASGRGVNGSAYLIEGTSSAGDPMFAPDRAYQTAVNVLNRDGVLSTRPALRYVSALPSGLVQGGAYFRPLLSSPYLVFAVDGLVYSMPFPFVSAGYTQLPNIQFFDAAPMVYFETAIRSARVLDDGTIEAIDPYRMLVMQDGGYTRAAVWDESSSSHVSPVGGIPLGGPMKFSGDRLWVASSNRLFASDIANPLQFTETEYLSEGGSFFVPEKITALAETSGETPSLVCFTADNSFLFKSGVRDRTSWKLTPNFQAPLAPGVGCVAPRTVVSKYGLLWWLTSTGLTNLNAAAQTNVSSKLAPQDVALRVAKKNFSRDLSRSCGGAVENFLLFSFPYGDRSNTQTFVYDQSVISGQEGWASAWTGFRPVCWVGGDFNGVQRLFVVTSAADGSNALWEVFPEDNLSLETGIVSVAETKTHIDFSERATGLDKKRFVFAEVHFTDIQGPLDVTMYWRGTRGAFKSLGTWHIEAPVVELSSSPVYAGSTSLSNYQAQSRVLRSPEVTQSAGAGVESTDNDWIDIGFSLAIQWTGRAALRNYRIFVDPQQEQGTGTRTFIESTASPVSVGFTPLEVSYTTSPP